MTSQPKKFRWLFIAIISTMVLLACGAGFGAIFGRLDAIILESVLDFGHHPEPITNVLVGTNACYGFGLMALVSAWVVGGLKKTDPCERGIWRRLVLPGVVAGGMVGAFLGFLDIALVADMLELRDSDNAASWREHRSYLPIVNAGLGAGIGPIMYAITDVIRGRVFARHSARLGKR